VPKLADAFVAISVKSAKFKSQMNKLRANLERLGTRMTSIGKRMAIAVTGPLIIGLGIATKAAIKQEKADIKLKAALKGVGEEGDEVFNSMKKLAAAFQKVTVFGDEDTQMLQALALNMGVTTKQMKLAITTAIGLSEAFGLDVSMALRGVALSLQGNTDLLKRYIPALRETEDKAEQLAIVLEAGARGFDQATAAAKTSEGVLKQAQNAFGDAAEAIGSALLPKIKELAGWVKKVSEKFAALNPETQSTILKFTAIAIAAGPVIFVLGQMLKVVLALGTAFKLLSVWIAASKLTSLAALLGKVGVAAAATLGPAGLAIAAGLAIVGGTSLYLNKRRKDKQASLSAGNPEDMKALQKNAQQGSNKSREFSTGSPKDMEEMHKQTEILTSINLKLEKQNQNIQFSLA
jgi:hypothetical protein